MPGPSSGGPHVGLSAATGTLRLVPEDAPLARGDSMVPRDEPFGTPARQSTLQEGRSTAVELGSDDSTDVRCTTHFIPAIVPCLCSMPNCSALHIPNRRVHKYESLKPGSDSLFFNVSFSTCLDGMEGLFALQSDKSMEEIIPPSRLTILEASAQESRARRGGGGDMGHLLPMSASSRNVQGSQLMRSAAEGDSALLLGGDLIVTIYQARHCPTQAVSLNFTGKPGCFCCGKSAATAGRVFLS